jgi:hypothetical protein
VDAVTGKSVVYSKQAGEKLAPVTVRIEWLPDGNIVPHMYWTPDNARYDIRHVYEMTKLAFLKDRGEGIRFMVKAELVESPEFGDELLNALYDSYLYLASNWFCGRNFIDDRYDHASKEYISVMLDVFPNCDYEVVCFTIEGARYLVEKTLDVEPRGSYNAGGVGVWHKVKARLVNMDDDDDPDPMKSVVRDAALFFEVNKWFVVRAV